MAKQIEGREFLIQKKLFKLLGSDFRVFNASKQQILFSHQKAFKWKEDFIIYEDESKTTPVVRMKARNIIDFSSTYDIHDAQTGEKLGAAKRKGWNSMLRDEWAILDANDTEIASLKEDSMLMALLRRFLSNLIPQVFDVTVGGQKVVTYKNNFNPIVSKVAITIHQDHAQFTPLFCVAVGILLCAVEGKQS